MKKYVLRSLRKLILGYRESSESYLTYLKKNGAIVGKDVVIYFPNYSIISNAMEAFLLQIGNHVRMTGPVTILTHDYSWSVLKSKYGEILGNQKKVKIGNNIFIGWELQYYVVQSLKIIQLLVLTPLFRDI